MKDDVLALASLERAGKRPSKETLNHPELIRLASGLDPYRQTPEAYLRAYRALGIDLVNRVPDRPVERPLEPGEVRDLGEGYRESYLGLYGTAYRERYPFASVEEFWRSEPLDLDYAGLRTPVPHRLSLRDMRRRSRLLGEVGLYYCMLYTTLFMWAVEVLGWEVFLLAAAMDAEGFDARFLAPAWEATGRLVERLLQGEGPFVVLHDDLADARGPFFHPSWYERYVFPRYRELFAEVHQRGKQVIFVADGNMGPFLGELRACGADGVMLENPATDFGRILETFGDRIVVGGAETGVLAREGPQRVRRHVLEVHARTQGMPGFVLSTPGGIHGGIPLENLEAYFDARVETGHTPPGWRAG